MTRRMLFTLASLAGAMLATAAAHAQTFKVDKYDIKGEGGTDYVTVEPATGRVFVSRSTHVMVVDGATGKGLGDIPNTPGVHGAGLVTKAGHGFTTNGGDQTITMFDLKTLQEPPIRDLPVPNRTLYQAEPEHENSSVPGENVLPMGARRKVKLTYSGSGVGQRDPVGYWTLTTEITGVIRKVPLPVSLTD